MKVKVWLTLLIPKHFGILSSLYVIFIPFIFLLQDKNRSQTSLYIILL